MMTIRVRVFFEDWGWQRKKQRQRAWKMKRKMKRKRAGEMKRNMSKRVGDGLGPP